MDVSAEAYQAMADSLELAEERLADLQLRVEDQGWERITGGTGAFDVDQLKQAARSCRIASVWNPLLKRGAAVRAGYVWGQGVGITARDADLNEVIQGFLDDEGNRAALTGHQAHIDAENTLATDGNYFVALFTKPLTGQVSPRPIPFDELTKITDPDDRLKTLFYARTYTPQVFDPGTGSTRAGSPVTVFHPDVRYRPVTRPRTINGNQVRWDAPIIHVYDNGPGQSIYGIGDLFAALPWAKAYKGFLEDWARLMKSLSKIAWTLTSPDKSKSQAARTMLQQTLNAEPAGGAASLAGAKLEAVPKTGATIDAESGRPLATMVAAALGLPVTTLTSDPGQTGARAVAETLNQPTRLEFQGRRELWTEATRTILNYVIDQAAIAPRGPLTGKLTRVGDELIVDLGTKDRTIEVAWPDLEEIPLNVYMAAMVDASNAGLDALPLERLRLILRALHVRDVDELIAQVTDANGKYVDPTMSAGQDAVNRFRRGEQ